MKRLFVFKPSEMTEFKSCPEETEVMADLSFHL